MRLHEIIRLAKQEKITVTRKDTGRTVHVSPETLKERGDEYTKPGKGGPKPTDKGKAPGPGKAAPGGKTKRMDLSRAVLPPPTIGKDVSEKVSEATKGKVNRQPTRSLSKIHTAAKKANEHLIQKTYELAKTTGGTPVFPPSTLTGFKDDKDFTEAAKVAQELKKKGIPVQVDEKKKKVLVFEPTVAGELAKKLKCKNDRGLKSEARVKEKGAVLLDEKGRPNDWGQLTDLARSSVQFKSVSEIYKALDHLGQQYEIVRFKDRFRNPTPEGYRDILLNVKMPPDPPGHVAEIQLHTEEILKIKNGRGHALYEESRVIREKAESEKRDLTPDETKQLDKLVREQRKLYNSAYQAAIREASVMAQRIRRAEPTKEEETEEESTFPVYAYVQSLPVRIVRKPDGGLTMEQWDTKTRKLIKSTRYLSTVLFGRDEDGDVEVTRVPKEEWEAKIKAWSELTEEDLAEGDEADKETD